MRIAVIGTGFIGGIVGRALARSGDDVIFGSRGSDREVVGDTTARVASIAESLADADVVILAIPGGSVGDLVTAHADGLAGKLVIDATNQMGAAVVNCRATLPTSVRYARAFNTLGGENLADPVFADGPADLFFSAPVADRDAVATVIEHVGLRPLYLGEDNEELVDALFRVWIELAMRQGHGRRLALRLLTA
jgi:predicted dinucleotide-binding enzyme